MNLSAKSIAECRERDGSAEEDRAEYVESALTERQRLGYRTGLPLVEPDGKDTSVPLGGDVGGLYDHYRRNESLLSPDSRDFLESLASHELVGSIDDIATELNSDVDVVEKAVNLHGIEVDDGVQESTDTDILTLPSGESVPWRFLTTPPWKDSRILTQLLATDGLSIEEASTYLSDQLEENISPSQIRNAAVECGILEGESTDDSRPSLRTSPHPKEVVSSGKRSTPWQSGGSESNRPWD